MSNVLNQKLWYTKLEAYADMKRNSGEVMRLISIVLGCLLSILLSGCISPKSYLDPSQPKVSYGDLTRPTKPIPLRLTTEFQRNGEPNPKANTALLDNSSRILRATGLVDPDGEGSTGSIHIVVNNVADIATAASKGFGTGLTLGLIGSTVEDNYELTMTITMNEKVITKTGIRNGIATAIGNTSTPPGVETFTPSIAFQKVLEQMILQALKQIQADNSLSNTPIVVLYGNTKQQLEELQGLRREGLISEREYQIKKKGILAR